MATDKKFAVAGVSTKDGKTKIRFANDQMRIKILAKNGHTDIELIDLPREMTKGEIAAYMQEVDFANGREEVAAAIAYIAKKNPLGGLTTLEADEAAVGALQVVADTESAAEETVVEEAQEDAFDPMADAEPALF